MCRIEISVVTNIFGSNKRICLALVKAVSGERVRRIWSFYPPENLRMR
jgi:3-polyprenyl-4-hydroxybenzoate decarboxylase